MPLLALIALVLFALVAFGVTNDDVNLLALGLAFLAAHLAVPTLFDRRP